MKGGLGLGTKQWQCSIGRLTVSPPYLRQPAARSSGCLRPAQPSPGAAKLLLKHQDASSSSTSLCLSCCRPRSGSVQVKFTLMWHSTKKYQIRIEHFLDLMILIFDMYVINIQGTGVSLHLWGPQLCLLWEIKAPWQVGGFFMPISYNKFIFTCLNNFSQTGKINTNWCKRGRGNLPLNI